MSRLQVGGLALVIKPRIGISNVGKVVTLIKHTGDYLGFGDCWYVSCEDGFHMEGGGISKKANIETYRLMPLGDDQTQAEFRKELDELVF